VGSEESTLTFRRKEEEMVRRPKEIKKGRCLKKYTAFGEKGGTGMATAFMRKEKRSGVSSGKAENWGANGEKFFLRLQEENFAACPVELLLHMLGGGGQNGIYGRGGTRAYSCYCRGKEGTCRGEVLIEEKGKGGRKVLGRGAGDKKYADPFFFEKKRRCACDPHDSYHFQRGTSVGNRQRNGGDKDADIFGRKKGGDEE